MNSIEIGGDYLTLSVCPEASVFQEETILDFTFENDLVLITVGTSSEEFTNWEMLSTYVDLTDMVDFYWQLKFRLEDAGIIKETE